MPLLSKQGFAKRDVYKRQVSNKTICIFLSITGQASGDYLPTLNVSGQFQICTVEI